MSYTALRRRCVDRHLPILMVAAILVVAACSGSKESAGSSTTSTMSVPLGLAEPETFADYIDANPDVTVVNVHIPYEGHIDGTDAFIAFDSILASAESPDDKSAPIALYCRSGNMSAQAAAVLVDAGYTDVTDLDGGMIAWEADGNDLLNDSAAADRS